MTMRTMQVAGLPARVARVGYTGELSFEINVRARDGRCLWESLLRAGRAARVDPGGLGCEHGDALREGIVSAGIEGDGILNPFDAGYGWAVDMNKGDFIGRRSLVRDANAGGVRPEVVGLLPEDASFVPPDGAPLVETDSRRDAPPVIGHVSQACHSPNLDAPLRSRCSTTGRRRIGDRIAIAAIGRRAPARVTAPCFVGARGR